MQEKKLGVTVLILNLREGICCFRVNLEHVCCHSDLPYATETNIILKKKMLKYINMPMFIG